MDKDLFEELIKPFVKKEDTTHILHDGTPLPNYEIIFKKSLKNIKLIDGKILTRQQKEVLGYTYETSLGIFKKFKDMKEAYPEITDYKLRQWSKNQTNGFKIIKDADE